MNLIICISYHKFYVVLSIILIKVKKVWLRTILKCHSCWDRSSTLYMQDSLGWTFFHPLPNTTNVYDTMFYIVYMLSVQHGKHWVKGIKNVCIIWKIKLQHWINQAKKIEKFQSQSVGGVSLYGRKFIEQHFFLFTLDILKPINPYFITSIDARAAHTCLYNNLGINNVKLRSF
jgi:hypothetical protein